MSLLCRATPEERAASLPGDEDLPNPIARLDHAITIAAPPASVWPWLAQMGADRAGWYSYDRLDNGGRPSARVLLPEHQALYVGDVFPALPGVTDVFVLTAFEPERYLLLGVPGPEPPTAPVGSPAWRRSFTRANWTFVLSEYGGATRLHVRARAGHVALDLFGRPRVLPTPIARGVARPIHLLMQRKQLVEIRRRAEGRA
ncbi:MAG: hypothetical protein H6739_05180 [Alphaproteobacteria bacterium]|nr:hypothetical protein [Alphaproteobacteria bacterium]